ncbi:hypothetical protein B5S29_g4131 [[Candida] boidinii]|uniref:Unnamed protein product n=1 Tax=Candida boidinii TaxID=5477 RepID=A0ACB5TKA8_CANBO|nr:hypothetical protein B5S29_g4131 [[Candida] boidinii]GME89831.1 unnamed protein product [[Candida] boidinii]
MSEKHWSYTEDLVHSHLKGLCHSNPNLRLIDSERVVYNEFSKNDKVMLLSGGGSGHEPTHAGFVGDGGLDIGVAGFVFASPSTKQIYSGLKSKKTEKGYLVIVKNYTGDILHFGLASERAKAEGLNVELLIVQDDVSVGRTKNGMVGRRGLAGTVLVHKITGGKAAKDNNAASLKEVHELGQAVVDNLVTIGASLSHVTIPGIRHNEEEDANDEDDDEHVEKLKDDEIEIGMGIHNEPGIKKISPIPTIDQLCSELLEYLLSKEDKERNYVNFDKNDDVVLLINNLGGTSALELYAIQNTVVQLLNSNYNIKPIRVYTGSFTSSLDGAGFSITLLNVTKAGGDEILSCLDYKTDLPGWNCNITSKMWSENSKNGNYNYIVPAPELNENDSSSKVLFNKEQFKEILISGLKKLLTKEPKITLYDTVAGDGDCGETLANGAHAILKAIDNDEIELSDGVKSLTQITDIVETAMGGTSGGLYSIFISGLAKSLKDREISKGGYEVTKQNMSESLFDAMQALFKYTRARTGDRTLVDALEPFVNTFKETNDFNKASIAAHDGAESTRKLKAKFGRASYVSEDEFKQFESEGGLPDPGAIGLAALINGFELAFNKNSSNL